MSSPYSVTLPQLSVGPAVYFEEGGAGNSSGTGGGGGAAPNVQQIFNAFGQAQYRIAEQRNVQEVYGTPQPNPSSAVVIASPFSPNNSAPHAINQARAVRDEKGNIYYNLKTGREPADMDKIITASRVTLNLDDPSKHYYDVHTNICFVTNPACTPANVMKVLRQNPAPFVYAQNGVNTDTVSTVPGLGAVRHVVDVQNNYLINVTLEGHKLHLGLVYQELFQDGSIIGIRTIGLGTGQYKTFNEEFAPLTWQTLQGLVIQSQIFEDGQNIQPFFMPQSFDNTHDVPAYQDVPGQPINNEIFPPSFDGMDYLASNLGLSNGLGVIDPVTAALHYLNNGRAEGRPTDTFNGLEYIASYADLRDAFHVSRWTGDLHYIQNGAAEGRSVSFSGLNYIASYGDLIQAIGADRSIGAEHYISYGASEGRVTTFNPMHYLAVNPDVQAAVGSNLALAAEYYINNGYREGRSTGG